jgi:signal peptidase II
LRKPAILIILILLADQISKFWVKTNMTLAQEFKVLGDWFIIHFTENYGMAFGLEFAGESGKLILTLFRIIAASLLLIYLYRLTQRREHTLLIFSITLIFSGAVGNIIDSVFYGMLFSSSTFFEPAVFLPEGGGYASIFHGRVVDMFYFPIIRGHYPDWFPFWGGQDFIFFRPVFNVADSSISIGVLILLIFQRKFFKENQEDSTSSELKEETQEPIIQDQTESIREPSPDTLKSDI